MPNWSRMTHLYGPAVRCKPDVNKWRGWSCASVSGPCMERLCSWPSVWTGRALQAGCEQMEGVVLRICIRPLHGAFELLAIMDIRAQALRGRLGHQITGTTARPFLHFLNPTRRPRRVSSRLASTHFSWIVSRDSRYG